MNKIDTLKKKEDFNKLYKYGKSSGSRLVVLLFRKNGLSYNREAFIASKKVGGSVERNRARRLMKEAFRTMETPVPIGYDIAFIARKNAEKANCAEVLRSIEYAVRGFNKRKNEKQ